MTWLRTQASRLAALFRKERLREEFDQELEGHLEMETEQNLRRGRPLAGVGHRRQHRHVHCHPCARVAPAALSGTGEAGQRMVPLHLAGEQLVGGSVSVPDLRDWRAQISVFEEMAAYQVGGVNRTREGTSVRLLLTESLLPAAAGGGG